MTPEEQLDHDMETVTMRTELEDDLTALDIIVNNLNKAVEEQDLDKCKEQHELLLINCTMLFKKFYGEDKICTMTEVDIS